MKVSSFSSPYFQLEQVTDGVYAAIVIGGTGAWGNAGIVDLGNFTLVFDTFFTPAAAIHLREAAEQVTGRGVSYVVNSHRHADHVFGNSVFVDATIIATEQTGHLMQIRNPVFLEQVRTGQESHELAERLGYEHDPQRRKELEGSLRDMHALSSALEQIELRLPDLTFEHRLVLYGTKRRAEIVSFGGGHTPSDALLYLPDDAVAFLGDLVQVRFHPSMGDSSPTEWMDSLKHIETLKLDVVVPGHGPVGTADDVVTMRHYLADLLYLVTQAVEQGRVDAQSLGRTIPAAYADWEGPSIFTDSVLFLYRRQLQLTERTLPKSNKRTYL